MSCGPCHSGAVRDAMLDNLESSASRAISRSRMPSPCPPAPMPSFTRQTCAVCHDPHADERRARPVAQPARLDQLLLLLDQPWPPRPTSSAQLINLNFNSQYRSEHPGLRPVPQSPRRPVDRHLPPAAQFAPVQHAPGRRRRHGYEHDALPALDPRSLLHESVRRLPHADKPLPERLGAGELPGTSSPLLRSCCASSAMARTPRTSWTSP